MHTGHWAVVAYCPHGIEHRVQFDELGYLKLPVACGHLPLGEKRPGFFQKWKTRRAFAGIARNY